LMCRREEFIREAAKIYWRKPEAKPQTAYRDRL
jgi:hypothetical protein